MEASYNVWLVALSVAIGVVASYTALGLASRIAATKGLATVYWLLGGAFSMGLGIWSMHFIGMLAFHLPVEVSYDIAWTAGSVALAIAASLLALWVIRHGGAAPSALSGLLLGCGIAAMHYAGIEAMEMSPPVRYDPQLLALSILVATLLSMLALRIAFRFRPADSGVNTVWRKLGGALVMGAAISAMHYIGMEAAIIAPNSVCIVSAGSIEPTLLAVLVGFGAFMILSLTLLTSVFDARLAEQNDRMVGRLQKANDELQRTIRELEVAKCTAESASIAKSQFLASMSHEVRTPMNGVLGMTQLVLETELSAKQRRFVESIGRCGESLLAIINDILDFSKIEANKLELNIGEFNLRELIEDMGELFAARAHEKGLELACEIPPQIHEVMRGDAGRLRQILTNLIGNAIKFTEQGEVVIRVVVVEDSEPEALLRFEVSDTGIGIAPEHQERIFDSFSQADSSTTRNYGGTGLGLAISRRLVELMGGEIGVRSRPDAGSAFHVELRLPKAYGAGMSLLSWRADLEGVRVLVVDDSGTSRNILQRQLEAWGMQPACVHSGIEALDRLCAAAGQGEPYPLVVLDMHMPRMDGLDVARAIRATPSLREVRVVMLGSIDGSTEKQAGRELGVVQHLAKPARQFDLFEALVGALDEHLAVASNASPTHAMREQPLSGKVLLVEDHPVNQELALAVLERLGICATPVGNGREALEKLKEESFELALMDCQMPEMDGFEATAVIRATEQQEGRSKLPIIAMTANAMAGDREMCLAAGMDDYLPKPFTKAQLREVLSRWLPQKADTFSRRAMVLPSSRSGGAVLDASILDQIRLLEKEGCSGFLLRVAQAYLDESSVDLKALRAACDCSDPDAVSRRAHRFKSSSGNLGALRLADLCRDLEACGRNGDLANAAGLLQLIEQEYERVREALTRHCGGIA